MEPLAIDSLDPILYVKFFVVFIFVILSFTLTLLLMRRIADLIIWLSIIGFTVVTCVSIYTGSISSWPEITGISILSGILACLVCIPILPFSSTYLNQLKTKSPIEPEKLEASPDLQTQPKL